MLNFAALTSPIEDDEPAHKPCPFCGSPKFFSDIWVLDDGEEVAAVECNKCLAGAPAAVWDARRV